MQVSEKHDLVATVQRNCHISDARHAGNYTMCVYLLKMREFFRWEQSHPFGDSLSNDDIGNWLTQREQLWEDLEQEDYAPITVSDAAIDPFESDQVNQYLTEHGLVYSGGIGYKSKPHFFIGELEQEQQVGDYRILISGQEYARDLTSPPAMSQSNTDCKTIYMRRESFQRMIWEKTEEWRWNKPDNAMARAIACYDFDNDLEAALDEMTSNELDAAILHEIGEIRAGESLSGWGEMMTDITFTQAEIMARAVRDHIADMLSTLPRLIETDHKASIHFYFANLTSMRKHIFPSLMSAYQAWLDHQDTGRLQQIVDSGTTHWSDMAQQMLAIHRSGEDVSARIERLINSNHL